MGYSTYFVTQLCVELPYSKELSDAIWEDGRFPDKDIHCDLDGEWMRIGPTFLYTDEVECDSAVINLHSLERLKAEFIADFKIKLGEDFPDILGLLIDPDRTNWKLRSYVLIR